VAPAKRRSPDLLPPGSSAGLVVELRELCPRRADVIAVARGSGGGRTLMLNAHMDVVGAGGMGEPWTPRIEGTRLDGRGAYDMKASLRDHACRA
jgi:acetylornithine deacetylase